MKTPIPILILAGTVVLCSAPGSAADPLVTATVRWTEEAFGKPRPAEPASPSPQPGDFWPGMKPPFSFVYDGKVSATLLDSWTREAASQDSANRSGMVLAFRHKDSPYPTLQVELRGLKPAQKYRVQFIDGQHRVVTKTLSGRELGGLELHLRVRHSSLLLRYAPRQSQRSRP